MFVPNTTRNIKAALARAVSRESEPVGVKPVETKPVVTEETKPVLTEETKPSATEESEPVGVKHDEGKARFDLVTPEFEEQLAEVLTFGAKEYSANSWKSVPGAKDRYYAALRRHLNAWRKGEKLDTESHLLHLAHVAANVMFLLELDKE